MELHRDRTILAAVIGGFFAVVAALISSAHWPALFGRTEGDGIHTERMEDESSNSGEQSPQNSGINHQSAQSAPPVSSGTDMPSPNSDHATVDTAVRIEPDELSPDVNYPKPASLPKIPDGYIQPGDVRGEVNKPREKELPTIPDNTIEPSKP
jgi:hypothetical protein